MKSISIFIVSIMICTPIWLTTGDIQNYVNTFNSLLISTKWDLNQNRYNYFCGEYSFDTKDLLINNTTNNLITTKNILAKSEQAIILVNSEYAKSLEWVIRKLQKLYNICIGLNNKSSDIEDCVKTLKNNVKKSEELIKLLYSALIFLCNIVPTKLYYWITDFFDKFQDFTKLVTEKETNDVNQLGELFSTLNTNYNNLNNIITDLGIIKIKDSESHSQEDTKKSNKKGKNTSRSYNNVKEHSDRFIKDVNEKIIANYYKLGFIYNQETNKSEYIID